MNPQWVREDSKNKVMYPFKPILQGFRDPPVTPIDTVEVQEGFFIFKGSTEQKKVKNPCTRMPRFIWMATFLSLRKPQNDLLIHSPFSYFPCTL